MPKTDGQGGAVKPRARLRELINEWSDIRSRIREMLETLEGFPETDPGYQSLLDQIDELRDERKQIVNTVSRIVENNPKLYDDAVDFGFREDLLSKESPGGTGGGTENPSGASNQDDVKGNDTKPSDGGSDGKGSGKGGGKSETFDKDKGVILGRLGKDYQLVRSGNGKYAVVYNVKIGNKSVKVAWDISEKEMQKAGLSKSDAKLLTRNQWKKIERFGSVDDIPDFRYDDERNPFDATLEYIQDIYGGQGILKNKEVARILAAGYIEGRPEQAILGQIRQTNWYQSRSDYQRQWLTLADGEKEGRINSTKVAVQAKLQELYGDGWAQRFSPDDVNRWATAIASGQFGMQADYQSAFSAWELRMLGKAQKEAGTPAQIGHDESLQDLANSDANAGVMFARIHDEAVEWLGHFGKPDQETLNKWAADLAVGIKSDTEWVDYLKRQKQSLYRSWNLDENERWVDAVSPYKGAAESILGTTLTFDDRLFADVSGKDLNGKPTGHRMTIGEFEDAVRQDGRFKSSDRAHEEAASLGNFLTSMFTGGGAY